MSIFHLRKIVVVTALLIRGGFAAESGHEHKGSAGGMASGKPNYAELGATAAFAPDGTLWAAHKTAGSVTVSRSADQGKIWSNPVMVSREPEPTDTGGDARPKVAVGLRGEIYVTWTRPMAAPYTGEIRFTRSLDGGRTFAPPKTVHADRQEITHRFDSVAVTTTGRVIVAWVDKRDLVGVPAKGPGSYRGAAIYYAVSDDRGANFRGDTKLADHSCECCRISLVPLPDGGAIAMWRHIFEPNIRDHAMARIGPDGLPGATERASFDDWALDACPHQGPALAVDDEGQRHAVWFSGSATNHGVSYGRPGNHAVAGLKKIGGRAAERPDVAVIGRRVAVTWKEFDGARTELRALRSDDGGQSWSETRLAATTGPSDHPRILTWQGQFHVFWNTRNEPLSVIAMP